MSLSFFLLFFLVPVFVEIWDYVSILLLSRLYYDFLFADLLRALPEIFETFSIFSFSLLWAIVFYFAPTLDIIDVLERFDGRVYIFKYI
jgi:hypothetical protein